jgi:hypothetical protein
MPTPVAVLSGGTRGFELGMFKKGPVAQGFNFPLNTNYTWWNGVDILSTQYLIYTDKYTMGSSTLANTIPVAWSTPDLNDSSLLALINTLPPRVGLPGFTDLDAALNWMDGTGDFFLLKNGIENIVTTNLLLYWDAGLYTSYVGTGTVVSDLSGNNKNGNLTNGASFSSASVASFDLDGTDDYISIGTLSYSNNVTVEAWVNTTNPIGWDDIIAGGCGDLLFGVDSSNTGTVSWGGQCNSPFSPVTSTTSISDGRWHHVVGTYNGSSAAIYVDGILERSLSRSGSFTPGTIAVGSAGGGGEHFSGNVAIARIYATALTADQVLQNYNAQKDRFGITNIVQDGLVVNLNASNQSSYPTSGTLWSDLSGNNNNATLTNGPTFSTDAGGAINFDGTNDFALVTVNDSVRFLNRAPYTLSVVTKVDTITASYPGWINREGNVGQGRDGYNLIFTSVGYAADEVFVFTERFTSGSASSTGVLLKRTGFLNEWHLILSTYDGTTLRIYYDSNLQSSNSSTSNLTNTSTNLFIANRSSNYVDGLIGNVQIYNKALSQPEIVQNYEAMRAQYGLTGVTTNGLILWLDAGNYGSYNGSGTTWYDISGSVNDTSLLNGPTYSTDGGGSILFDGTNDVGQVTIGNIPTGDAARTISVWVKYIAYGSDFYSICGYGAEQASRTFDLGIAHASQKVFLDVYGAGGIQTTSTVSPNVWFNVTGVYTGTQLRLYLNGSLENSNTFTINTASSVFRIADMTWSSPGLLNGNIGNVIFYNRALSDSEVLQNFNAQRGRYGV